MKLATGKARPEIGAPAEGTVPLSRRCIGRVLCSVSLGVLLVASQRSRADTDVADQAKQSQNPSPTCSQQWTVPLGGGIGQIVHVRKLPVNMQLSGVLQRSATH